MVRDLRKPNHRAGADAGIPPQRLIERKWPGTAQKV
jgi:hypothetical protein